MLLHLWLGLFWRGETGRSPAPKPAAGLQVRLSQPPTPPRSFPSSAHGGGGLPHTRLPPDSHTHTSPAPGITNAQQAVPDLKAGDSLLELAKRQIDSDSRRQTNDPMFAAPARQAGAALSPLARALDEPVTGERRIGDRLHQYTTAGGRRFCISAPPDIDPAGRDLPTPARTLVPTNCPQ